MKKKILILIFILAVLIPLSVVLYPVLKNNNYNKKMLNDIKDNTNIKNIKHLNKDNNYYIIKTKEKIIVLDLNYEEKLSIDIKKIEVMDLELVYRRNNLYYEEKIKEDSKLIYKFYNIETGQIEYETLLGGV